MSLRLIFAGTPEFATWPLKALLASEHQPVAVFTQPDRPAGRGNKLTPPPVKALALAHGIPVHQPLSLKDSASQALVAHYHPDVIIVVAYGLILPNAILNLPRYGCLNIHASLLPRWRGAAPIARAIEAGDEQTGVDIMRMDTGLDTGDIVARAITPIGDHDQITLHHQLAIMGSELLLQVLSDLPGYLSRAQKQSSEGVTYAHKLKKEEARLDWTLPAIKLAQRIRAFVPWPGSQCQWQNQTLKIQGAHATGDATSAAPGQVLGLSEQGLLIATGDGVLCVHALQRPGGKMLPASEFIKGCNLIGQRLS